MGNAGTANRGVRTLFIAGCALLAACAGEENLGPVPIQKSTITISPSVLDFDALADIGQLKATRLDGQGRPSNLNHFVWRSLDPRVAQIDGAGRVVSLSEGKAIIEVSASGEIAHAEIVVDQLPVQFAVGPREDTLSAIGQQRRVSLEARDRNGFRIGRGSFEWESADPRIVTVDDEGMIRSQDEGRTEIRVRKRGKRDSTRVTVKREKSIVSVSPRLDTLKALGEQLQLSAAETDAGGNTINTTSFDWTSSAPSIVAVSGSGVARAMAPGTATVTAVSGGRSGEATIVVHPSVDQITISPPTASLGAPGQTVQLVATGQDAQGQAVATSSFAWASDRPSVATVDASGIVRGVGPGTARITATAPTGAKGFASVSVGQIALNVAPRVDTLVNIGDATSFAIYPTDALGATATCPSPQWQSSDGSVASVNEFGKVVAKAIGSVAIIVSACGVQDQASVTVTGGSGGGGGGGGGSTPPPSSGSIVAPELPRVLPDTTRPAIQRTVRAHNASELQNAINNARPGDEILLDPGATYSAAGGFNFPARGDGGWAIVRTDLSVSRTARIDSTLNLAKITCTGTNCAGAQFTQAGDHGWRLEVVEITSGDNGANSAVRIHSGGTSVPQRIVLDRTYIHAEQASWDLRRCIIGNGASVAVIHSVIVECHERGGESQGFAAWTTPGPILFYNNLVSASSIHFILGGSDPANSGLSPSDITVARNHFYRPQAWKGGPWTIKNCFELKNVHRAHIWGNVFENVWRDGQAGYCILLKSSGGAATFTRTEDVYFERNILRNVEHGFNLARNPDGNAQPMRRVLIENVVIEKLGPNGQNGGSNSRTFLIQGPDDLMIRGITSMNPNVHSSIEFSTTQGNAVQIENFVTAGPTQYGLRVRPISQWYGQYAFVNAYAVGDNCSNYGSGWSCPSSRPSGSGANASAVSGATAGVVR